MDHEKDKYKGGQTITINKQDLETPQLPAWAEKEGYVDEKKENSRSIMIRGTDMLKVPCFKSSFMNSIGSTLVVGIAYNLGTSRNPMRICGATYTAVLFGSWIYCRLNYRKSKSFTTTILHVFLLQNWNMSKCNIFAYIF